MKSNPFKGFITYGMAPGLMAKLHGPGAEVHIKLCQLESEDPTGATWGTMGFVEPIGNGDFAVPLDGTRSVLLMVKFNDRILPGKVRDEHLRVRVAALADQQGRPCSKKEYAQLRDDVEAELLPKSHIRRTFIPVLVYKEHLVIFTTSAKRANDIVSLLFGLCNNWGFKLTALPLDVKESVSAWLTAVAKSDDDSVLAAMDSAVIRRVADSDKAVYRIKDKDIDDAEVQELLVDENNRVTELSVSVLDGVQDEYSGIAGLTFNVNSNLIVKGMKFPDLTIKSAIGEVGTDDSALIAEFIGMATLVALSVTHVLEILIQACGGENRTVYEDEDEL